MKTSTLVRCLPFVLASGVIATFTACNGGGSSSSSSGHSSVVYTNGTVTQPVVVEEVTDPVVVSDSGSSYDSGSDYSGNDSYTDDGGCDASGCSSLGAITHDTDLQKATTQAKSLNTRAQIVATNFQMSVGKATQLVSLADKVKLMTKQGTMTDADQAAISNAAFKVAGVSADQVSEAVDGANNGKMDAANSVLATAAATLGMPSAAALRDKLLPALGVNVNN